MKALVTLPYLILTSASVLAQEPQVFDHSLFDGLLRNHVTSEGMVDYDAFGSSPDFQAYLSALAEAPINSLSEHERLALWINAYNAYTIELVNQHDERESIRNINKTLGLFGGKGPWKERMARVGGKDWTLDEVEQEIIRKEFTEPRIHFALVCAALGCPPLRAEAYTGDRLDEQLQDQGRLFVAESPGKNEVDMQKEEVRLSRIFDWYEEDFPKGAKGLGPFLAQYLPPGPEKEFLVRGEFQIKHTDYDWSLNILR